MSGMGVLMCLACQTGPSTDKTTAQLAIETRSTSPLEMSVQTFHPISKDAVIIDVRTDQEYNSGHVPNARHIPLNALQSQLPSLSQDLDEAIYFICASGVRSAKAAQMAHAHGYTKAINIKDGTYGWRSAGFPLE